MIVVKAEPPMFDIIDQAFNVKGKPVIFCWGETIFNPQGGNVTPELIAHEAVHCAQQAGNPSGWWRNYIDDKMFRLDQEIPAHQAEFKKFCELHNNRELRARFLHFCATRLASDLYGKMISTGEAMRIIRLGTETKAALEAMKAAEEKRARKRARNVAQLEGAV